MRRSRWRQSAHKDRASGLAAAEVAAARAWGAGRALGIALRAAGLVDGQAGTGLLAEAVDVLRAAPAPLELARALVDLGAAQRRSGARNAARETLRAGLDLAYRQGGLRLAERARRELVVAGGKPRRDAIRGRDALTPSELRVAELAAGGQTNRQIAQALFITQRTVENHLTGTYGKLGIGSRSELPAALAASRPRRRRVPDRRGLSRPGAAAGPRGACSGCASRTFRRIGESRRARPSAAARRRRARTSR